MKLIEGNLVVSTSGQGLKEITSEVARWLTGQTAGSGLLTLFLRHTSASLLIQENADPDVRRDLEAFFARLVVEDERLYIHTAKGPDDMPAHIRSALLGVQLQVPVSGGRLGLGTWQGIYLFEHRRASQRRDVTLTLIEG